jgi:hypothetical protein
VIGLEGFAEDAARWRRATPARAPAYHRTLEELVALLKTEPAIRARFEAAWAERSFSVFYERPLLLLAALRFDALIAGRSHPLFATLGAPDPDPDAVDRRALLEALELESVWNSLRTRFVQTNESSRAVAWLWPAWIAGCDAGARPLALLEIGAAAGLNLVADRLASPWIDTAGAPVAVARSVQAVARVGLDAHPLDATCRQDIDWMRACIWAGERERLERFDAAVAAFREDPPRMVPGDVTAAPDLLRELDRQLPAGGLLFAFQTIVRDYLGEDKRAAHEQRMSSWLGDTPAGRALWVELEIERKGDPQQPVPILAHTREASMVLGRTGYHPARVEIEPAAVERLRGIFSNGGS